MKKPDPRTTVINWNGGGRNYPLKRLFKLLATEPLDPVFEKYGNFAENVRPGVVLFWGNFANYSHAFSVESSDPEFCQRMVAEIKANQAAVAYKEAKDQRREIADYWEAKETKRRIELGSF